MHAAREPALLDEFSERYRRLRTKLAELAPAGRARSTRTRWAIVTLALSNGLALERVDRPRRASRTISWRRCSGDCSPAGTPLPGSLPRERSRVFPLKDNIPTDRLAIVTIAFIVINVIVYFLLQKGGIFAGPDDGIVVEWGAIPYEFTNPGNECVDRGQQIALRHGMHGVAGGAPSQPASWVTAFSSMFMHGGILHLGGNMLFLWIFGNNVEDSMGPVKFVALLPARRPRRDRRADRHRAERARSRRSARRARSRRCSAATSCCIRGRASITVIFIIFFFTIIELPAMLILGFWFLQQVAFGAYGLANPTGGGGGVAYFAHIGGFVFGLAAIKLFASRKKDYSPPPKYPVY